MPFQHFDDLRVPDNIFKCGGCGNILFKRNQKYCDKCGTELNWRINRTKIKRFFTIIVKPLKRRKND